MTQEGFDVYADLLNDQRARIERQKATVRLNSARHVDRLTGAMHEVQPACRIRHLRSSSPGTRPGGSHDTSSQKVALAKR
jgi:hypothetical protein